MLTLCISWFGCLNIGGCVLSVCESIYINLRISFYYYLISKIECGSWKFWCLFYFIFVWFSFIHNNNTIQLMYTHGIAHNTVFIAIAYITFTLFLVLAKICRNVFHFINKTHFHCSHIFRPKKKCASSKGAIWYCEWTSLEI